MTWNGKEVVISFANQPSVFNMAPAASVLWNSLPLNPTALNIPSSITGVITSSPTSQTNMHASYLTYVDIVLTLLPVSVVTIHVLSAVISIMLLPHVPGTKFCRIFYKKITLYNPITWHQALINHNFLPCYPNLICNIKYSSLISNPPHLSDTFIPKNLVSMLNNPCHFQVVVICL